MTNRFQEMLDEGVRNHTLPPQERRRLRDQSNAHEEGKQEGMATAQEKIHILQKRIDDMEKAERVHHRESGKEVRETRKEIMELAKFCVVKVLKENNNAV